MKWCSELFKVLYTVLSFTIVMVPVSECWEKSSIDTVLAKGINSFSKAWKILDSKCSVVYSEVFFDHFNTIWLFSQF